MEGFLPSLTHNVKADRAKWPTARSMRARTMGNSRSKRY